MNCAETSLTKTPEPMKLNLTNPVHHPIIGYGTFILVIILFIPLIVVGQAGIKRQNLSSESVLLEFAGGPGGIVLPWVNSAAAVISPVPGTFIYDVTDKHVKFYSGASSATWIDLSGSASGGISAQVEGIQGSLTETSGDKTVIGSTTSTADGVWVLESETKAMVLPIVSNPETTIVSPVPGIIVYDPDRKLLCTFNGEVWSFWTY